jgi:pimeloyl-ACP methyl ester carboxylesterase
MVSLVVGRGGFELRGWVDGAGGVGVLCVHETATSAEVWWPLAREFGGSARVAAYDRRGWGRSGAPEDYRRTTVEEQAGDAVAVIGELGGEEVVVCGAGIGAIVALQLALRRPELVRAAVLIEPPLLSLVPAATPAISADVEAIRRAVTSASGRVGDEAEPHEAARAGAAAALDLYRSGGLEALGGGAERIPADIGPVPGSSPFALFAEVAAVSAWTLPLAELATLDVPLAVAVSDSTPPFIRRAAESLADRLPAGELRELRGSGLPQLGSSTELAATLRELS